MATTRCRYCNNGLCIDCKGTGRKGVNRCPYCEDSRCKVCKGSGQEYIVEDIDD